MFGAREVPLSVDRNDAATVRLAQMNDVQVDVERARTVVLRAPIRMIFVSAVGAAGSLRCFRISEQEIVRVCIGLYDKSFGQRIVATSSMTSPRGRVVSIASAAAGARILRRRDEHR